MYSWPYIKTTWIRYGFIFIRARQGWRLFGLKINVIDFKIYVHNRPCIETVNFTLWKALKNLFSLETTT